MKRILTVLITLVIISLACSRQAQVADVAPTASNPSPESNISVPDEYQELYSILDAELDTFIATLPPSIELPPPVFAAELSFASGNSGYYLLEPGVLGKVNQQLDFMQSLGLQGVGMQISYPLLQPDFPRADEYLTFYKQVASQIHQRGMLMLVETGPVFPDPEYSGGFGAQVDYSDLTVESYFQTKQEMLTRIAREIQPDYLALGNEPGTEAMLTGLNFTPQQYFEFVENTLVKIGDDKTIKIGAGAGNWEDPTYLEYFLQQPQIDFIDLHIYPIGRDGRLLTYAQTIANRADKAHKDTAIGEAWLYKTSPGELGQGMAGDYLNIYSRDVFGFWEPLDEKFMQAVVGLSQTEGVDFVSFFWTRYFIANLNYNQVKGLSTLQLNRQINRAANSNLEKGILSPLGEFYKSMLEEAEVP